MCTQKLLCLSPGNFKVGKSTIYRKKHTVNAIRFETILLYIDVLICTKNEYV